MKYHWGIFPHYILIFFTLFILTAMGMHLIEFHHDHSEFIFGTGMEAVMHGGDKKIWIFVIMTLFLLVGAVEMLKGMIHRAYMARRYIFEICLGIFDKNLELFRTGVMHPKLCE